MKCITPLGIRDKNNQTIPVECGKCPECIKKRTSQWSFRLRKEGDASSLSLWITLTYNTETVPITKNGFLTLQPQDVTDFIKRLRQYKKRKALKDYKAKKITKEKMGEIYNEKIKYYYVGEYGTKKMRPHYHMIIFNAEIEDIENTWNQGQVYYGQVTGASIGYTLKYMIKDGKIPMHQNDDRVPEFGRMSKGLGLAYLTADVMYYHTDKRKLLQRLCAIIDGKKIPLPRYYKERIYDNVHKYLIKEEALKHHEKKFEEDQKNIDISKQIAAQKAQFDKMYLSKYKNKHV